MNLFQITLLILIALLFFFINRSGEILFERLLNILVGFVGVYFVLFPESASKIANLFGIGRGADLIIYLFIIFSLFWFTSISGKLRRIDRKITDIVRANAIANPIIKKNISSTTSEKNY